MRECSLHFEEEYFQRDLQVPLHAHMNLENLARKSEVSLREACIRYPPAAILLPHSRN